MTHALNALAWATLSNLALAGEWPSFRGPLASGVAEGHATATSWDVPAAKGVKWKVAVPGLAHSSPIVSGGRVFATTAVREGGEAELRLGLYGDGKSVANEGPHTFELHCYDEATGELRWKRECWKGTPEFERHTKASFAASTPATDGERVIAYFGSEGLFCVSAADGAPVWEKDFGSLPIGPYNDTTLEWGCASSPLVFEGRVIVQVDTLVDSFVAVLDLATGEERWRTVRDEHASWCTPNVDVFGDRSQVICNGWQEIGGYDLETGAALWKITGGGDIPVPTPVVAHGLIFLTSGHGQYSPLYAVPYDVEGEIEFAEASFPWFVERSGNYMQTPLVYGDELYSSRDNGAMTCRAATTGEVHYTQRLGDGNSGFSASPVAADGKVYFTSEAGDIYVVRAGKEYELLAQNPMGEECMATPAISDGVLFWRTRGHLVAIGGE